MYFAVINTVEKGQKMADSTGNSPEKELLDDKNETEEQEGQGEQLSRDDTMASEQNEPNPFEITLSEFKPHPKLINVHQFYPSLEHQFHKSPSRFEEEQNKRTEQAMKEIVEESSTFALTDNEGTMLTTDVETTQDSLQIRSKGESTDLTDEDSNNSGEQVMTNCCYLNHYLYLITKESLKEEEANLSYFLLIFKRTNQIKIKTFMTFENCRD